MSDRSNEGDNSNVVSLAEGTTKRQRRKGKSTTANDDTPLEPSLPTPPPAKATYANGYLQLFEKHLKGARRDAFTGRLMLPHEGQWISAVNLIDELCSYADDTWGFLKPQSVRFHLARYARQQPRRLLIDLPEWDGVDRLKLMAECLQVGNIPQQHVEQHLKAWGARMFQRMVAPKLQNECLILAGGQGAGKDTFITALVEGLDLYLKKPTIVKEEKDMNLMMRGALCMHIEEFDRTSKMGLASLKEMITKSSSDQRDAYGKDAEHHVIRCSFIASCNPRRILRDPTGNRRFKIFEVEHIDWKYPRDDSPQLLAQWLVLGHEDYRVSQEAKDTMDEYIRSATPQSIEEVLIDEFDGLLMRMERPGQYTFSLEKLKPALAEICKDFNYRLYDFLELIKSSGRFLRSNHAREYFRPEHAPAARLRPKKS